MQRVAVTLGAQRVICSVALTTAEQTRGLQGRPALAEGEGLLFPFYPPRAATFHMGAVRFPIDLVFADAGGRVARIVHDAQPGTRARWSHPAASAVIETAGGFCARNGVDLGAELRVAGQRIAQSYNLLRTLVEAETPPLTDGYYSEESFRGPELPREDLPPEERFREHRLPDESFSEAMDQPYGDLREQFGYQPTDGLEDVVGPNVRMTAQVDDPGQFAATLVEAMARAQASGDPPIRWQLDYATAGASESAIINAGDVDRWLRYLNLDPETRSAAVDAATTGSGLEALADELVLAGLADVGRVMGHAVVLFRGRRS